MDAILYINKTGCQWRLLSREFGPWQTVYYYFASGNLRVSLTTSWIRFILSCANLPAGKRVPAWYTDCL
ncbi:MAG: transposase [Bacteroidaceae bacterium]|nr:transposase [Bacteroidaceae bacterium]